MQPNVAAFHIHTQTERFNLAKQELWSCLVPRCSWNLQIVKSCHQSELFLQLLLSHLNFFWQDEFFLHANELMSIMSFCKNDGWKDLLLKSPSRFFNWFHVVLLWDEADCAETTTQYTSTMFSRDLFQWSNGRVHVLWDKEKYITEIENTVVWKEFRS